MTLSSSNLYTSLDTSLDSSLDRHSTLATLLSAHQAQGIIENFPVAQFEIGPAQNFVYLILNWSTRTAAIVDPQSDLTLPQEALKKFGFTLAALLLTHTHWDHIAGVPGLLAQNPTLPIYVHTDDQHRLSEEIRKDARIHSIQDGDLIPLGNYSIRTLFTPGHSAGECCFFFEDEQHQSYLFTGDTVFIQDCGRTDFETGSTADLFHSLQKIRQLPPSTLLLPGHHYRQTCTTLLEQELKTSPPFQCQSVAELDALP